MNKDRISVRKLITIAANNLKDRLHKVRCCDEEVIFGDNVISVEYHVRDDKFREIEIVSVDIFSQRGDVLENITSYVFLLLDKEAGRMNKEAENDYLDTLSNKERRDYNEWIAS